MTPATDTQDREALEEAVDDQERPTVARVAREELPPDFRPMASSLNDALNDNPPPATFPEEERYPTAWDVKRVAELLIPEFHDALEEAAIAYFYRQNMTGQGYTIRAKMRRAPGRIREHFEVDFYLDVNWQVWIELDAAARVRLIDHELCHATVENTTPTERRHEIEEFLPILQRWGPRGEDQERMAEIVRQGDLFS